MSVHDQPALSALERLRRRWIHTADLDHRHSGNKLLYFQAYDRYYMALGIALGYERRDGYFVDPDGVMPGCNVMAERLARQRGELA